MGVPREQAHADVSQTGVDMFADLLRQSRQTLAAEMRPHHASERPSRDPEPVAAPPRHANRQAAPREDDIPRVRTSERGAIRESELDDAGDSVASREAREATPPTAADDAAPTSASDTPQPAEGDAAELAQPATDVVPPGSLQPVAALPVTPALQASLALAGTSAAAVAGGVAQPAPGAEGGLAAATDHGSLDQGKAPNLADQIGATEQGLARFQGPSMAGRFGVAPAAAGLAEAGQGAVTGAVASVPPQPQAHALTQTIPAGSSATIELVRDAPGTHPVQPAGGLVVALAAITGDATSGGDGSMQGDGSQLNDPSATMAEAEVADGLGADFADAFLNQFESAEAVAAAVEKAVRLPAKPAGEQATGGIGQVAQSAPLSTAKPATPPALAPRPAVPPPPAEQIRVGIERAINEGKDSITMQLRPEKLGHIEVKLEVAADGRLSATIAADNKDTLQMLQRDARDLQRALEAAGFSADQRDLNFNLRQGREQAGQHAGRGGRARRGGAVAEIGAPQTATPRPTASRAGGLDIRV